VKKEGRSAEIGLNAPILLFERFVRRTVLLAYSVEFGKRQPSLFSGRFGLVLAKFACESGSIDKENHFKSSPASVPTK
jgi:hypothetical protein